MNPLNFLVFFAAGCMAIPSNPVLLPLTSGVHYTTYNGAVPLVSTPLRTVPVAPPAVAPSPFVAPNIPLIRVSESEMNQDQVAAPLPIIYNSAIGAPSVYTQVAVPDGSGTATYGLFNLQPVPSSGDIPEDCTVVKILGKEWFMVCKNN
ncbi:uncharacterized protein LOC119593259 [Penaeus monodon]|uniref:uncharacterized protein LOC119593259 n=1 Tax=Penaeus monodon TaxID=6687 RepID=UPI0018A75343|nr:uncharacterized protein LOC119593259 [Penaeus monodon]